MKLKPETRANSLVHLGLQVVLEGLGLHPHSHPEGETNDRKTQGGLAYRLPRGQAPTFSPFSPGRPAGPWGPGLPGRPLKEVNKLISKKLRKTSTQPLSQQNSKAPSPEAQARLVRCHRYLGLGDPVEKSGSQEGYETQTPSHPQGTCPSLTRSPRSPLSP